MKPHLHEDWIDSYAYKIVKTLQDGGFESYLVGGCVRDLLVGIHPKDFDIATSASPQQVRKKVANAYIIGRRFRLVLVKRGDIQYEVATFRRSVTAEELADEDQTVEGDNFFGTAEQDAMRRDFTVNGLFYDPVNHKLHDFCEGLKDIEARVLRIIGDPKERLIEDPIRILRAIRLSHKINFALETSLRGAMLECCHELKKSALPRRREEYIKFLRLPESAIALMEIFDLGVMKEILPGLDEIYANPVKFEIFDAHLSRIEDVGINKKDPGELFAALLFSFFKAKFGEDAWNQEIIEADSDVLHFMRDEIGIFKQEAGFFWKALDIMPGLQRRDTYSRKGERRKSAYVKNEAFILALKLAQLDFSLSVQDLHFWMKELETYAHLPSESFDQEVEA
jgi:poly(A) polymerase